MSFNRCAYLWNSTLRIQNISIIFKRFFVPPMQTISLFHPWWQAASVYMVFLSLGSHKYCQTVCGLLCSVLHFAWCFWDLSCCIYVSFLVYYSAAWAHCISGVHSSVGGRLCCLQSLAIVNKTSKVFSRVVLLSHQQCMWIPIVPIFDKFTGGLLDFNPNECMMVSHCALNFYFSYN